MGFARGFKAAGTTLTGACPVRIGISPYLVLDIVELNGVDESGAAGTATQLVHNQAIQTTYNTGRTRSAFAKVHADDDAPCNQITDVKCNVAEFRPAIGRLERLTVAWRFHDGTPVQFRGADHAFTLQLTTASR